MAFGEYYGETSHQTFVETLTLRSSKLSPKLVKTLTQELRNPHEAYVSEWLKIFYKKILLKIYGSLEKITEEKIPKIREDLYGYGKKKLPQLVHFIVTRSFCDIRYFLY